MISFPSIQIQSRTDRLGAPCWALFIIFEAENPSLPTLLQRHRHNKSKLTIKRCASEARNRPDILDAGIAAHHPSSTICSSPKSFHLRFGCRAGTGEWAVSPPPPATALFREEVIKSSFKRGYELLSRILKCCAFFRRPPTPTPGPGLRGGDDRTNWRLLSRKRLRPRLRGKHHRYYDS